MPFPAALLHSAAAVDHGAACVFFCQPTVSPPVDSIGGASGTLVGGSTTVNTGSELLHTPGTANTYCSFPTSAANFDVPFATGWTLEFHVKDLAAGDVGGIIARGSQSGAGARYVVWATGSGGGLQLYFDGLGGSPVMSAAGVFAADGVWRHIAIVRNNSTWRMYKDGVEITSATGFGNGFSANDGSSALIIGDDLVDPNNRAVSADFSRIKISKAELYTAPFTPPSRFDP